MTNLELIQVEGGTRLKLRVRAGARRDAILGAHGGALKLSVTSPAEKGKANRAMLSLLAGALDLPANALSLISGQTSPDKVVLVPLAPDTLAERLSAQLA